MNKEHIAYEVVLGGKFKGRFSEAFGLEDIMQEARAEIGRISKSKKHYTNAEIEKLLIKHLKEYVNEINPKQETFNRVKCIEYLYKRAPNEIDDVYISPMRKFSLPKIKNVRHKAFISAFIKFNGDGHMICKAMHIKEEKAKDMLQNIRARYKNSPKSK